MYGSSHRGGGLLFGNDGFLYLSTGDQTASRKSQDITNNLDGGVLRLDVNRNSSISHEPRYTIPEDLGYDDEISGRGYFIPNDNPFTNTYANQFEEYYSLGHRNPHRMSIDRTTGNLYVGEVGGNRHEEINVISKGKNYGWPLYEGLYRNTGCVDQLLNNMPHQAPLVTFPRAEVNVIIGGFVYRGSTITELQGKYLCADFGIGEEIYSVDTTTGAYTQYGNFASSDIISFGEDIDNEIYLLKYGRSTLFKLVPRTTVNTELPKLLSQTGAFDDLSELKPTKGLIPYDLIESFWSDGALKKRWMAIPNDGLHDTPGEQINYSEDGDWDFPIGSVLIKHFEFPVDDSNTSITKRLETRFSVKGEDGKFYFATYKWNKQQTDAELLKTGIDERITINNSDGSSRSQIWRYPDNAECTTCHNTASNGNLGTRSRYLNTQYTYPSTGLRANQLTTLSHLRIINKPINNELTKQILTYKAQNDPYASLEEKARSYLDLNCAYCHRSDVGSRADFDLRLNLSLAQSGLLTAVPNENLGLPNKKILDPGVSENSILYHRMNTLNSGVSMPPLATNRIDSQGVNLIKAWIDQLAPSNPAKDIENAYYRIQNTFNGDVLSVADAGRGSAFNIQTQPNLLATHQTFKIQKHQSDAYTITAKHSQKNVDVTGSSKIPGTNVWQFSPNNSDAQKWEIKAAENGLFTIKSKVGDLYLEASNRISTSVTNVSVNTRSSQSNQLWKLLPIDQQTPCEGDFQDLTSDLNITEITARAEINTAENRYKAFDKKQSSSNFSKWLDNAGVPTDANPSWIQITFVQAVTASSMIMVSGNDFEQRDPQNFRLLGSNGDGFELIQQWANQNFTNRYEPRAFSFNNDNAYQTYRLEITKNKNNDVLTQFGELTLFGCSRVINKITAKSQISNIELSNAEQVSSQIQVYPNPIVDHVIFDTANLLEYQPISIHIYDSHGRLVRTIDKTLNDYGSSYWVDFNGLMSGLFIANITLSNGSIISKRLIVK